MISTEIEDLIIKYFTKSAKSDDLEVLNSWIQDPENQLVFKDYVKTHFAITIGMNDPYLDKIKKNLLQKIRKEKSAVHRLRLVSVLKYVAIAILFMGMGFFLQQGLLTNTYNRTIVPKEGAITLQLDNGDIEIISEDGTSRIKDTKGNVVGVQQGKKVVYGFDGPGEELIYNTLSVPYGKRFNIVLSDGTNVFLNAGSSIKYPVRFVNDSLRQVFLTGEAYFDVAHDKQLPFVVNTQELDVQVYGTEFNVANYPEDKDTEVVLVNGSVSLAEWGKLGKNKNEVFLTPGFKGTFNKTDKKISNKKVNTSIYTSWMSGNLVFRNVPFKNIIQKLERHYNVTIINNNLKLANETFNATIETDHETIEQVFSYFNKVYQIEYRIIENKIIIN